MCEEFHSKSSINHKIRSSYLSVRICDHTQFSLTTISFIGTVSMVSGDSTWDTDLDLAKRLNAELNESSKKSSATPVKQKKRKSSALHIEDEQVVVTPPRKGGRNKETNTSKGIAREKHLWTPSRETPKERKNRMQNIRRHWAREWYHWHELHPKYEMLFAFRHPWKDLHDLHYAPVDQWERPDPPIGEENNPSSYSTPDMFLAEYEKWLAT